VPLFQGPPPGGPPGTPIMPSPQDSSNSGGENMYTIMKPVVPGGNIGGDFSMGGGGSDGSQMGPMGGVLNGDGLDGMKNSPANGSSGGGGGGGGPGTPRDDSGSGMGDYNLGGFGSGGGENVRNFEISILKKIQQKPFSGSNGIGSNLKDQRKYAGRSEAFRKGQ
jgi:Single-stranded DNA binding protein, SSDP